MTKSFLHSTSQYFSTLFASATFAAFVALVPSANALSLPPGGQLNPPGDPVCTNGTICTDCESESEEGEGGSSGGGGSPPVAVANIGSINWNYHFGNNVFGAAGGGKLKLRASKPFPDLYDPSILFYTNTAAKRIVRDDTTDGKRSFYFFDSLGLPLEYAFDANATTGFPTEKDKFRSTRAYLLNAAGNVVSNVPNNGAVYFELRFPSGAFQRFSIETRKIVSIGTATGQILALSQLPAAALVDVIYNGDTLRQIKNPDGLLDISFAGSGNGFVVKVYPPAQVGAKSGNLYSVSGNPVRTFTFENPDPDSPNPQRLRISDSYGSRSRQFLYTYQTTLEDWALDSGAGASKESKELISAVDSNPRIYQRILRDENNAVVSKTKQSILSTPWKNSMISSQTIDPDGLAYTTNYTYDLDESSPSAGGLLSQTNPDGSWARYEYDSSGRMTRAIAPWLDSPVGSAASASSVFENLYTSHDSNDSVSEKDSRPRTVVTKIAGIETGRIYYVYGKSANGESYEIEERAAAQGSAYGATGNLRTTKIYHANSSGVASAGRVKIVRYPNNTQTSYSYSADTQNGNLVFTVIETQGTVSSPDGIAGKTLRKITTADARGVTLKVQTFVYTGSGYSPLNTVEHSHSAEGYLIQTRKDNRVVYDATYSGGLLVSTKDETGIEKTYTYDSLDRRKTETKIGAGSQPDIVTTYTRALGGIDCGCDAETQTTISAGGLSLTSSLKKNQAGRVTEETTQSGLVTSYAYTDGGRTVLTLKPNTATEIRQRYLDGSEKTLTGTGVTAQFYTRGVNADGTQWTKTNQVSANGLRWTKTTTNFLGQVIKTERPGFGDGIVLGENSFYNAFGQLASQTTFITPASAASQLATGARTATFVYDVLGNQISNTTSYAGQSTAPVTSLNESFLQNENATWYAIAVSKVQFLENGLTKTITTSIQKQQLNNFSGDVLSYTESYTPSNAVGENFSLVTPGPNKTTQTITLNRATKTLVSSTQLPTSTQPAVETNTNGLLISSVSPTHGGVTLYRYDAFGRPIGQKQPRHTAYSIINYNNKNQIISSADAASNTNTYTYYANGIPGAGQLYKETNSLNHSTYHQYDFQGRETHTWGTATYPTAQTYDSYGNRATLTTYRDTTADFSGATFPAAATGDTTTWNYDPATGLLLQKLYADNKGPSYTYYADGLLKTRLWARRDSNNNSLATDYTYTPQGQLNQTAYSDNTPAVTYSYNVFGQQLSVNDGTGTRAHVYDSATNALIAEVYSGLLSGILHRAYDPYSRPVGYALADAFTNSLQNGYQSGTNGSPASPPTALITTASTYAYDSFGNFSQVQGDAIPSSLFAAFASTTTTSLQPFTNTYARLPNSTLISAVTSPVHTVANTYETNRDVLLTKQNTATAGPNSGSIISQYAYATNSIGQRVSRQQSGFAFATASTDAFSYNTRGEVVNSTNTLTPTASRYYSYDPIGNRLFATEGAIGTPPANPAAKTYLSNALNQYTQINTHTPSVQPPQSTASPTYDLDGNMLTDGTGKLYTWDAENRLIQVTLPNGEIVKYSYDSNSRRIKREHTVAASTFPSAPITTTTLYLYDSWNVISEKTTVPNTEMSPATKTYHWGLDLSNALQSAGGVGGLLRTTYRPATADDTPPVPQLHYHLYDANGNTSELLDSSASITAHYEYDPFGKERLASGSFATGNTCRFSTKFADDLNGLYYYGYRFYDKENGLWLNRDIIDENGGANLYGFLFNNSINRRDILGLFCRKVEGVSYSFGYAATFGVTSKLSWQLAINFSLGYEECYSCCSKGSARRGESFTDRKLFISANASFTASGSPIGSSLKGTDFFGTDWEGTWWAGIQLTGGFSASAQASIGTDKCNNIDELNGSVCLRGVGTVSVSGGAGASLNYGALLLEIGLDLTGSLSGTLKKCYTCKNGVCGWDKSKLCVSGSVVLHTHYVWASLNITIYDKEKCWDLEEVFS